MKKEPLLISACLLGIPCRYDGRSVEGRFGAASLSLAAILPKLVERYELVPVCPEIYGGLPTPRTPSERVGELVRMRDGRDVTQEYSRGADAALSLCRTLGIRKALLKAKSPSCGVGRIYDGTFSGTLTDGDGVTAERLKGAGIAVFCECDLEGLLDEEKRPSLDADVAFLPK